VSSLKSHWSEILVAGRVEQVEGEPSGPDHRISGTAPAAVPRDEHEVAITLTFPPTYQRPLEPFDIDALPAHDLGPWPERLSLRREDLYDKDGR
jgi:hypothetical protein